MAEGARLESVFTRKGNVGSNPTLSAITFNNLAALAISCNHSRRKSQSDHFGRSDVDWLKAKLRVERAIARYEVDDVKTIYSGCATRTFARRSTFQAT